ncbi:MAG: lipase family protein [Actinomycetota bacterium]|nr:lipase family protein [Actinomycetota bacterium]
MTIIDLARQAAAPLLLVSPPRRRTPGEARFYEAPSPLPEGRPGDLIRAERCDAYLTPGLRLRARAWRILYLSTTATGELTAVSGTVMIPRHRKGEVQPLVGYAIGTHGIGDAAAPSRLLPRGLDWEAGLMAMQLARGWALAVTDYQGLGTPGDHTYMVGRALGPNVLDSMRAARALCPDELPLDGPAGILGYSEGGSAAGWAAQLQPTYAPEIKLAGVVAGAAAADLGNAECSLNGTFFSFFIAYGGIGYAAAYPELELDRYLTPMAAARIAWLRRSTVLQAALFGPRYIRASDLTEPNVLEMPDWRARLRENKLGEIAPDAPVLLHHARRDQIVSFTQSVKLREEWEQLGADVRLYVTRGGVDHISGAIAGTPVALDWLARRLGRGPQTQPPVSSVVEVAGAEAA